MTDLASYVSAVNRCIAQENGRSLATLLSLPPAQKDMSPEVRALASKVSNSSAVNAQCESRVSGGLGSMVGSRLAALAAVAAADWAEANKQAVALYNAMLNAFREEGTGWMIPVVNAVSNDLRVLATEVRVYHSPLYTSVLTPGLALSISPIKRFTTETMSS